MRQPEIWTRDRILSNIDYRSEYPSLSPLDPKKVPEEMRKLIPYAEIWGMCDDGYREDLVEGASQEMLENLSDIFMFFEDDLMNWLSGPEADSNEPTKEYVAFSALFRAGDLAKIKLGR